VKILLDIYCLNFKVKVPNLWKYLSDLHRRNVLRSVNFKFSKWCGTPFHASGVQKGVRGCYGPGHPAWGHPGKDVSSKKCR